MQKISQNKPEFNWALRKGNNTTKNVGKSKYNPFSNNHILHDTRTPPYNEQNPLISTPRHTQLATYTSSEGTRRQFMNFYRLVKTHSLLNSLFLADSITRDTYNSEVKETLDKIHLLKQQLERYDLKRFCELWGIETEFNNLGKMNEMMKSDMKVGIGVARVANMLPMISDEIASASNYG